MKTKMWYTKEGSEVIHKKWSRKKFRRPRKLKKEIKKYLERMETDQEFLSKETERHFPTFREDGSYNIETMFKVFQLQRILTNYKPRPL